MHRTLFSTPVVNTVLRALSLSYLKLAGWKVEGTLPETVRADMSFALLEAALQTWQETE